MKTKIKNSTFMPIALFTMAAIGMAAFMGCAVQSADTFDLRYPQPLYYPGEKVPATTDVQFQAFSYDQNFPYDLVAHFGTEDLDDFEVQQVTINGHPVQDFLVYNGSIKNLLRRAAPIMGVSVRFLSRWEPETEYTVEISGKTPGGKAVQLAASGTSPQKNSGSGLSFQYPAATYPYFYIHCSFGPESYKPFTIESITANGEEILNPRILNSQSAGGRPEQIRALQANDGIIKENRGFSIDFPFQWKADEEIEVVVTGKTEAGESQKLQAKAKATWASVVLDGWKHSGGILVQETAGVERSGEPVKLMLGIVAEDIGDPYKEIRVATRIPGHPNANSFGFVEVPCQVTHVTDWNDPKLMNSGEKDIETGKPIRRYMPTKTVELVFLATMQAYEERVFMVCYGNSNAEAAKYESDLHIEGRGLGQSVSNDYYKIGLAKNSAAVETVLVRGEPDVLLEHKIETNGAVQWNPGVYSPPEPWVHASDWENPEYEITTGPLMHRISRYANLPFVKHTAAQVTNEFYADQPYVRIESVMQVKEDIFVQALRNGEIVFNHAVLDEFVWMDERGKIQCLDLNTVKKHPIHALEVPADTPWIAFISRKHGVGFANINIDYTNVNLYGDPVSQAQPYIYVQVGPWIYWSRGLVYPFGHANFTRMMPVRKGSVYCETNAYLPFHLDSGPNPFATVERYHKILTQPLLVSEHIPQHPETPKNWIMPLLTAPFDEGVDGAHSAREVPKE